MSHRSMRQVSPQDTAPGALPRRRLVIGLTLFSAISAICGGIELIVWRRGNRYVPIELLQNTLFETFLIPGLLLACVIGGANLACTIFAWRRSRAAIDATIVAGGALTIWIIAEIALLHTISWLHFVYGALGLAILCLGLSAAWRSRLPRHRWVILVTIAEASGFMAPAVAGILSSKHGLGDGLQAAALATAGLFEGLALGAGQAWAFPLRLRRLRYALLTALGAGIVWAVVMSTMLLAQHDAGMPLAVVVAAIVVGALVGLAAIGSAQWVELRHHAPMSHRWIGWTALAWAVALPLSFTPSPLVDESTPMASHIALWGCAGLLMAYVMALITWQGVRGLCAATVSPPSSAMQWRSICVYS